MADILSTVFHRSANSLLQFCSFFVIIFFHEKVTSVLPVPWCFIKAQELAGTGCPPWEGGQANRKRNDESKSSRGGAVACSSKIRASLFGLVKFR